MVEIRGNLWTFHMEGDWVAITTNGDVRGDGHAVMGRGVAWEATVRFPKIAYHLGKLLKREGNFVHCFNTLQLFTFPVKHHWKERADLELILDSAQQLVDYVDDKCIDQVYMVRPGCGNGKLDWSFVKPRIEPLLDDRFVIVERRRR